MRYISLFITGLVLGFSLCYLCFLEDKKYVYVDVDRLISVVSAELVKGDYGDDLASSAEKYRQKFDFEIKEYSKNHNAIIFSSAKPIAGAAEKTDFFIKKVLQKEE